MLFQRLVLLAAILLLIGCPRRGDDDDASEDDDDSATADDDDSSAPDDDDATADDDDDDDATADDDDASSGTAPTIDSVNVCETQLIGTSYLRFDIQVSDPDGNLLAPVRYFLTFENAETGATYPLTQFTVTEDMESGGTISHLLEIGVDGLERGVGYEFSWYVLDTDAQSSNTWIEGYFVNAISGNDPC